jgi:poly-gamma-glutamate synthase PgsB/CapB
MAVQPQYQWIAEHQMVKSHIGVITNVRPDHLEEMGPTEEDVAYSLCNTVPVDGILVTAEEERPEILEAVASQNNSRMINSSPKMISEKEVNSFKYIEHPSNIALALDVCKEVGIEREIALRGMHKVQPDNGALIEWNLILKSNNYTFINGMAANDPVSTLDIWNNINKRFGLKKESCIFLNSREDRPVRTVQMIKLTLEQIKPNYLIIRGSKLTKIIDDLSSLSPKTKIETFDLGEKLETFLDLVGKLPNNCLIYAIGNQVGAGQEILELISRLKTND